MKPQELSLASSEQLPQHFIEINKEIFVLMEANKVDQTANKSMPVAPKYPIRKEYHVALSASGWSKFKEAVGLIFQAIGKAFSRKVKLDSQSTPSVIYNRYKTSDNKTEIGEERSRRLPGITDLIATKEAEVAYFSKHAKDEDGKLSQQDRQIVKRMNKQIDQYKASAGGDTWVTANRVRDEGAQKKDVIANYLPVVVNHRQRIIEAGDKAVTMSCSGAISHMADGSTNLRELQDAAKEERERLLTDQMVQYLAGQVNGFANDIGNPASITRQTGTLQITQVSLLDPKKKQKMEKGVVVSEKNQMIDMAEMFKKFNGKELKFTDDVTAPLFNGDKEVLIPRSLLGLVSDAQWTALKNNNLKLSCTFFNCSVQGLTKNVGEQALINLEATNKLATQLKLLKESGVNTSGMEEKLKNIETRLGVGKEESSYELAKDILLLQQEMGGVTGINCYSGKDRTGYLSALVSYHYLSNSLDLDESAKRTLASDLIGPDGLTAQIIEQNTGFRDLKIKKWNLIGVNEGSTGFGLTGHFLRAAQAVNAWFAKS